MYDFVLMINGNLDRILHGFIDTATYRPQIAYFPYSFSFSALARGDPFQIHGKALWTPKEFT